MTTKAKALSRVAAPLPVAQTLPGAWVTPPWTMEERLQRIEAMGQRINTYVEFMCQVGSLNGSSVEAKDRAVTAFHERMAVLECQLGRIQAGLGLERVG